MPHKSYKPVIIWLYSGVLLIILMVAVGGAVRLNNSGLSIVQWKPITGIIPPLNNNEWQKAFDDYKKIPEFKLEHNHFKLNDFKIIFLWEYFHRLIARIIGLVFIIPFIFFWIKGYFKDKKLFTRILLIFIFALFQAWMGWYMVKSGFSDRTDVSHYRLAIHLFTATLLVSYVLWTTLNLHFSNIIIEPNPLLKRQSLILLFIISIQLFLGAFTAGLNAGYYYTDYPLMGGEWFPTLAKEGYNNSGLQSIIDTPAMVYFVHRWFAVLVFISIFIYYFYFKKKNYPNQIKRLLNSIIFLINLQFILGIITVLTHINIYIAILHQVNAILIFLTVISIIFFSISNNGVNKR